MVSMYLLHIYLIVLRLNSGGFFYINLKNERSHEFKNTLLQSYNPVPI